MGIEALQLPTRLRRPLHAQLLPDSPGQLGQTMQPAQLCLVSSTFQLKTLKILTESYFSLSHSLSITLSLSPSRSLEHGCYQRCVWLLCMIVPTRRPLCRRLRGRCELLDLPMLNVSSCFR